MAEPNPDTNPELESETNIELKIDNTMLALPNSFKEAQKLFSTARNHEGLGLFYKSYRAYRSLNLASIFLFGKTGSGKSSTLNHLFGHDLIPTSSMESCTRDVIEYGCTMDSTHWKVEGLGLGFVDTPGYGDTDGSMQDARNLATINGYIHTKYTKWNRKIYPNIVLVVVNGSDNRMFGIESEFSQMLHVLSKLNIVDRERPNVVIAVTHALNLKKKRFIEKSQAIAKDCTVLSKLHLIIEAPVVFIENDDEDDELEIDEDWKILPDGTRQPLNLYQAMMNLMKESGDEVGVETIRIFFSNAKDFKVEQKYKTPQIPWNTDNNKAIDCWAEIIKEYLIGSQSKMYQILLEASKSPELCMSQPEVMVLAHNLRIAKILKPSDIEGEKVEKIKRTLRPYVLNDSEINILCRVFKLKPTDQLNFDFLGRGCSRKEKTRKVRILNISTKEFSFDKGIFIPLQCHVEQCGALNVDIKYTNEKGLRYRLVFSISRQNLKIKMEYTVRYTLFKVVLNDPTELSLNAKFDDYLKKYFARVSTNPISQSDLPDHLAGFDGIFGTRLITGIHFGGVLKGFKWIEAFNCTTELIEYVRNFRAYLESYFDYLQQNQHLPQYEVGDTIFDDLKKSNLSWRGGDKKFHSKTLGDLTPEIWNAWIDTLNENLVLFDDYVQTNSLFNILSNSSDVATREYANLIESYACTHVDINDLYYYTAPDLLSENEHSKLLFERVYTRFLASEASKSKKSQCSIM